MEFTLYLRALAALCFVLVLIIAISYLVRKYGLSGAALRPRTAVKRLTVEETLLVDARRRLMIVRCREKEYAILLGEGRDTVLDSWPVPPAPANSPVAGSSTSSNVS